MQHMKKAHYLPEGKDDENPSQQHHQQQLPPHLHQQQQQLKPYMSNVDPKGFIQSDDLVKHMKMRTHGAEIKTYKCDICLRTFKLQTQLIAHMRVHTAVKHHACDVCGATFANSGQLAIHRSMHLLSMQSANLMCQLPFPQYTDLALHMASHPALMSNMGGLGRFYCGICKRAFLDPHKLERHMITHSREKPFKCEICLRTFKAANDLARHMTTHSQRKQLECEVCHKTIVEPVCAHMGGRVLCASCGNTTRGPLTHDKPRDYQIGSKAFLPPTEPKGQMGMPSTDEKFLSNLYKKPPIPQLNASSQPNKNDLSTAKTFQRSMSPEHSVSGSKRARENTDLYYEPADFSAFVNPNLVAPPVTLQSPIAHNEHTETVPIDTAVPELATPSEKEKCLEPLPIQSSIIEDDEELTFECVNPWH